MNIVLNYDPVAAADPSFVADAQAAVAILNRTFTNNITVTFNEPVSGIAANTVVLTVDGEELVQSLRVEADPTLPLSVIAADEEPAKTLKCKECGTMNLPTEWYCEGCGAELAAV